MALLSLVREKIGLFLVSLLRFSNGYLKGQSHGLRYFLISVESDYWLKAQEKTLVAALDKLSGDKPEGSLGIDLKYLFITDSNDLERVISGISRVLMIKHSKDTMNSDTLYMLIKNNISHLLKTR